MQSFTYTITEPVGIHARPAGLLVKEIKNYQSTVTVTKGDKSVNALKLMALMGMGVKQGETVTVKVEGDDEEATAAAIASLETIAILPLPSSKTISPFSEPCPEK